MKRVLFTLSMPGCNSWDGKWSGAGRDYSIKRTVKDEVAKRLFPDGEFASWYYHWSDGWGACVKGRVLPVGDRTKASGRFSGYDWMVDSILARGEIRPPVR